MMNAHMDDKPFGVAYVIAEIKAKVESIDDQLSGMAGKAEVAFLSSRMDIVVPRTEHELHWKRDDERFAELDERLERIETKLDDFANSRLPKWFLPLLAIVVPVLVTIAAHVWK